MLRKTVKYIGKGGLTTTEALASYLKVSPAMARALRGELERLGYLERIGFPGACAGAGGPACGSACSGCRRAGSREPVMWELKKNKEKGYEEA